MAVVFKIKCRNTLRRLTIEEQKDGILGITFRDLVAKICNMFQISPEEKLVITYMDQDNDVVTMGDDQDLRDACILQRINPLRIQVNMGKTQKDVKRFNCTAAEEAELCGSSHPVGNHTVEELIKLVNDWHTKGASFQNLQHYVTSYGLPVQANTSWREAETVDATSWKPCLVDNISQRLSEIFHKGVHCNVCGMTPIVGPRFKSTRKENFDLCCGCFALTGNEMEFQRIDRPIVARKYHRRQFATKGKMRRHFMNSTLVCTPLSCNQDQGTHHRFCANSVTSAGGHYTSGKLDARFVEDVTIFDGTEMVAGTHFTKIWRVRNIGTLPWPHATQLVYTGGDVLGSDQSSSIELPAEGLPCEQEINVSVDLVAPQSLGRYVSHWRLRAPTGQKFGQRIWVLIQVIPNCMQSALEHAANEVSFPATVDGPPTKFVKQPHMRQMANGIPAEEGKVVLKSNHDGSGAWDAMFSLNGAPAQDRQDSQSSSYQAERPMVSADIIDMSCNKGCLYMRSSNVGTRKDEEMLSSSSTSQ